jgi:predicted nucleotidyltransferase
MLGVRVGPLWGCPVIHAFPFGNWSDQLAVVWQMRSGVSRNWWRGGTAVFHFHLCYNFIMMTLGEIKEILKAQKPYLAKRYGVTELAVFGSYVRGEQQASSDIDLLIDVERPPKMSLIDLVELEIFLSEKLNTEVDIALKANLRPRIGQYILQEMEPV